MTDHVKLFFRGLARHAPGSDSATLKALKICDLPDDPEVWDLGAGTGSSALVLAEEIETKIVAVDLAAESLEALEMRAERRSIADQIECIEGDFLELDIEPGSVDLIWSEGAIYVAGWDAALDVWTKWLKPGGYIVVTDCVWVTEDRPEEAAEFWADAYAEMSTVDDLVSKAESAGLEVMETFEMPRMSWADYYGPLRQRAALVMSSEPADALREVVEEVEAEMDVFDAHGHAWNYAYFVMRKP